MVRIVICDDDSAFAKSLAEQVRYYFKNACEISIFENADALRSADFRSPPDLALMDIQLDTDSGIALAREVFPSGSGTAVIFITGYIEFCTDVYEASHVYFLLKPLQPEKLYKALEKAMASTQTAIPTFTVQTGGQLHHIHLDQVLYMESFYRKLRIVKTDCTLECYGSISSLPARVKGKMIHCHKSFLVNPAYIKSMSGDCFTLSNNDAVPISHKNKTASHQFYMNYLAERME